MPVMLPLGMTKYSLFFPSFFFFFVIEESLFVFTPHIFLGWEMVAE